MKLRNVTFTLCAILFAASLATYADAQTTRGAAAIKVQTQSYPPVERAACGPRFGRWCGPWHHRVCGRFRCWCAHC